MQLHQEILDSKRREVWQQLPPFKKIGYLAGGTALALQLGHRISYDFDIFCPKPISAQFTVQTIQNLGNKKRSIIGAFFVRKKVIFCLSLLTK